RRHGLGRRRRTRRWIPGRRRLLGPAPRRRQHPPLAARAPRAHPRGVDRLGELDRAGRARRSPGRAHHERPGLRSIALVDECRRDAGVGVLRPPGRPSARPAYRTMKPTRRILYATDLSPASARVLAKASRFARASRSTLLIVHVLSPGTPGSLANEPRGYG